MTKVEIDVPEEIVPYAEVVWCCLYTRGSISGIGK